jgi:hypothetical protein
MKQETVSLDQLTAEQKQQLMQQLEQRQKEDGKRIAIERANYKKMVDEECSKTFPSLQQVSRLLTHVKRTCIDNFQTLIRLKAELYGKEEEQTSHSFTTKNGTITIIIGYNMIDAWDDTANTGIAKVNEYIRSLASDKKSKSLVDAILRLLAKDNKGNLKASRVLQLKQMAEKSDDSGFVDAVNIIQDAYRPVRSKEYIRCIYTGTQGEKMILPLSITDAGIQEEVAS